MEEIRAFIAIELPAEVKSALAGLQAQLCSGRHHPVKWVDPQGIHLTLKFLGNVPAAKVDEIINAVREAARDIPPFPLELTGLGVFPGTRKVRVVWVGLGGEIEVLKQLQQRIEANLVPLGFARESRPFSPHLTLCRTRESISPVEQQSLGQLVSATACTLDCRFDVHSVSLMRSQLTPSGAIYHQLGSVELKRPLAKN
jgi:2'-5' RNA ligase